MSSPGRYDSLIFDLDGTLWDTCGIVVKSWNRAVKLLGIDRRPITRDDIRGVMGMAHVEILGHFLTDLDRSMQEKVLDLGYELEQQALQKEGGELFPDTKKTLEVLGLTYPLFLVSNCQKGYMEAFFGWSGLKPFFKDWESHGNTGLSKADNLRSVKDRNHLTSPVYIGDTEGDRAAAERAEMPFIHMKHGFGKPLKPCPSAASFPQLITLLKTTA